MKMNKKNIKIKKMLLRTDAEAEVPILRPLDVNR